MVTLAQAERKTLAEAMNVLFRIADREKTLKTKAIGLQIQELLAKTGTQEKPLFTDEQIKSLVNQPIL